MSNYPTSTFQKIQTAIEVLENWPLLLPDKLKLINDLVVYKTKSGTRVYCRPNSPDVNETVIIFSDHEYPSRYLKVSNNATVLDIGANIGLFDLYINQVNPETSFKIYAFEPFRENVQLLKKNLEINKIHNTVVIQKAVSSTDGTVYIDTTGTPDSIHLTDGTMGEAVESIKLSTFAKDNSLPKIDLLKMDIEGSEYDIFNTDFDYIANNVDQIIMEFHNLSEIQNYKKLRPIIETSFEITVLYQIDYGGVLYAKNKNFN